MAMAWTREEEDEFFQAGAAGADLEGAASRSVFSEESRDA